MNKQELKEQVSSLPSEVIFETVMVNKDSVLGLIDQLDEPKKVVVPKFVAEWLKHCEQYSYNLSCIFGPLCPLAVKEWITTYDKHYTILKALLDGYEIEQEKLYTVEIPDPHNGVWGHTVLYRLESGKIRILMVDGYNWGSNRNHQLTEAEIKEDFEWAWRWAKEVE